VPAAAHTENAAGKGRYKEQECAAAASGSAERKSNAQKPLLESHERESAYALPSSINVTAPPQHERLSPQPRKRETRRRQCAAKITTANVMLTICPFMPKRTAEVAVPAIARGRRKRAQRRRRPARRRRRIPRCAMFRLLMDNKDVDARSAANRDGGCARKETALQRRYPPRRLPMRIRALANHAS